MQEHLHLNPGDRIIIPKSQFRLVQHHAIYDGKGNFLENKIGKGVVRTPFHEFFEDVFEVKEIFRFQGTPYQAQLAIQRAESLLGKSYDLINFNCEHFADYALTGRARSRQVETIGSIAGIGLLLLLFSGLAGDN